MEKADAELLSDESELDLMRKVADFPEEIAAAALSREPHRVPRYLLDLATLFHAFYTRCRVLGEEEALTDARLMLVKATQIVLGNGLKIMGVSAPERM